MLQVPQTNSSNAKNACFIHDWPICSNRSVVICSAAHAIKVLRNNRMIGMQAMRAN